jgi:hypothetical protein
MINCLGQFFMINAEVCEHWTDMTFSILARDPETGAIGGAAATGSLCVGGWVLRGDLTAGMSASQGAAPSTFWGEEVLGAMRDGLDAASAADKITTADRGRDYRQLSALDLRGGTAAFTGSANEDSKGSRSFPAGIAAATDALETGAWRAAEVAAERPRRRRGGRARAARRGVVRPHVAAASSTGAGAAGGPARTASQRASARSGW